MKCTKTISKAAQQRRNEEKNHKLYKYLDDAPHIVCKMRAIPPARKLDSFAVGVIQLGINRLCVSGHQKAAFYVFMRSNEAKKTVCYHRCSQSVLLPFFISSTFSNIIIIIMKLVWERRNRWFSVKKKTFNDQTATLNGNLFFVFILLKIASVHRNQNWA